MSRYIEFPTPENVEVGYELAGIGSRFVAALIDHLAQLGLFAGAAAVAVLLGGGLAGLRPLLGGTAPLWAVALLVLWGFVVLFGYHVFYELRWAGQSPGKRYAGIRVVRDGGYPIDVYASVVRNLVRIVDFLPPPYGAAIISVFASAEYKRLGDWAAGTLVIKESHAAFVGGRSGSPSPMVAHFLSLVHSADALTLEEFTTIRRFVERRHELEIPVQAHLAMRLAVPLMRKLRLDIPIAVQWHYADLLEAIERRYVQERGVL